MAECIGEDRIEEKFEKDRNIIIQIKLEKNRKKINYSNLEIFGKNNNNFQNS